MRFYNTMTPFFNHQIRINEVGFFQGLDPCQINQHRKVG